MTNNITFVSSVIDEWPTEFSTAQVYLFIDDYITYQKIHDLIPDNCINKNPGHKLDLILREIEDELVNLDELAFSGKFYSSWLASSFAESNPYRSDFFLNVCRAIFLVREIPKNSRVVIVIENIILGEALRQIFKNRGCESSWIGGETKKLSIRYYSLAKTMLSAIFYAIKYKIIYKTKKIKKYSNPDILLLSWVGENHFSKNNLIDHSPYFGSLPKWIREKYSNLTWLASPINWAGNHKTIEDNIKHAVDSVIPLHGLVSFIGIFKALVNWLCFPLAIKKNIKILGVNISPLVRLEVVNEMSSPQIINACLFSNAAKSLKAAEFDPKILIYTFENQPWEKILIKSFRKEFSNIYIIGNQTAPFSELYLSGFPTKKQWEDGSAPDKLVVVGDRAKARFIGFGASEERIVVGGSLRLNFTSVNQSLIKADLAFENVLVSCPIEAIDSLELISKSIESFRDLGCKIRINFHPASDKDLTKEIIKRTLEYFGQDRIEFTNKLAVELFKATDLVAYSSTGVVFEALQQGISCLCVEPLNRLNLCKFNPQGNFSTRSVHDIRNAFLTLRNNREKFDTQFKKRSSMVSDFVAPPNKELWLRLIKNYLA